jgi:hypothetical protein
VVGGWLLKIGGPSAVFYTCPGLILYWLLIAARGAAAAALIATRQRWAAAPAEMGDAVCSRRMQFVGQYPSQHKSHPRLGPGWNGDVCRLHAYSSLLQACTVKATAPNTDLVSMFANFRPPLYPGHVVGMITQVDLISGLYWLGVVKARLHSCDVILCVAIQAHVSPCDSL